MISFNSKAEKVDGEWFVRIPDSIVRELNLNEDDELIINISV